MIAWTNHNIISRRCFTAIWIDFTAERMERKSIQTRRKGRAMEDLWLFSTQVEKNRER